MQFGICIKKFTVFFTIVDTLLGKGNSQTDRYISNSTDRYIGNSQTDLSNLHNEMKLATGKR